MPLIQALVGLVQESIGTRGAVANCRRELDRNVEAERQVAALARRLPPAPVADGPLRRSA